MYHDVTKILYECTEKLRIKKKVDKKNMFKISDVINKYPKGNVLRLEQQKKRRKILYF